MLEAALIANTRAVEQLTAEIALLNGRTKAGAIPPSQRDTSEDTRAISSAEIEKAKLALAEKAKPAPQQPAALSFEGDLKGWALALVKKDKAKLLEIYAKYSVKVGAELKPDQLAAFKVDLDAATKAAGITAPAAVPAPAK